jgi:hypothetical protein
MDSMFTKKLYVLLAAFAVVSLCPLVAVAAHIDLPNIPVNPESVVKLGWVSGLISAIGSIGGGLLSKMGSADSNAATSADHAANRALQKEFAQSGIQWKVADAKKAGIHPLYALGANTTSYSGTAGGYLNENQGLGQSLSQAGQDIGRAVTAAQNRKQRALSLALAEENVANAKLNNDILRTKLASDKARLANINPPMDDIEVKPSVQVTNAPGRLDIEAATSPETKFYRTHEGVTPVYSEGITEGMEENPFAKVGWGWRNYVQPLWDKSRRPPKSWLPKGATHWRWTGIQYKPAYGKDEGTWADRAYKRYQKTGLLPARSTGGASRSW